MKISVFAVTFILFFSARASLLRNHEYWYTTIKSSVIKGVPFADYAWNYCDLKCLYLEHYYPGYDFVYINFKQSVLLPNFAACYIRKLAGNGAASYALWNTVASNNWYNTYCGKETANYYAQSQGSNAKYSVVSIKGVGIGNYPIY